MAPDHDAQNQQPEELALKIPEEWYRTMIQTANEGIWLIDANAHTLYVNHRMAAMLGTSPVAMTGHAVFDFTFPEEQSEHLDRIRHNIAGASERFDCRFRRTDGSELWVLGSTSPLHDSQGNVVGALGMFIDVTERKRVEEALRRSETRFRKLVESNIVGITIADLSGAIHEANAVFLTMLGYSQEELLAGKVRWDDITPPEYRERDVQAVQTLRTTGVVGPYEKAYIRKDGSLVPVLVGVVLLDERLTIAIVLDISERKELERRKDEFISIAGHELRTPLTIIKGNLQLAVQRLLRLQQQQALPEETITATSTILILLRRALHQANVEQRLIADLMDVSRIQANKLELSPARFDLVPLVREVAENQRLSAPRRLIQLDLPAGPVPVFADHHRIGQVISNYLTNALKYSPEDQVVEVGLRLEGQYARCWVRDHGPGLSLESQKHLWERFYRAPEVKVQSGSGAGLGMGLYICRTLITLHNGSVGVESAPGKGSTFWFTLPLYP